MGFAQLSSELSREWEEAIFRFFPPHNHY
ncbi:Hypothetical protein CpCP13_1912 [Corynebacterium pseudotuberculosis]|nr:Hypothetical protein CpPAT10_1875a [Corynebacterium pseudotuberculosis PAT10]AEP71097.1 Hypothetical protein Cp4202_1863 [Corynebacterium pseudotuberculosis 42/02-A]AFF23021.1 Hypothetical protein CpP54B96_1903 [Corynebacterium pseudotuberculosis P54B96]AFH52823.1 Hypothetical protein Cp267_1943 [Corynebacterium pseudotuberculosis 267]ANQ78064.1 Hypothetical protein CpCP13_1912 [Corynebacterium pseudotuberculosis]